jgi:autotransporter-associated beta strand protein
VQLSYSTDGTNWTALPAADFGAFNSFWNSATPSGGTTLGSTAKSANISGLSIPINGHLYLRWNVLTLHSNVHWGFGLDNVSFQVTGTAPAQLHWLGDDTTRGGQGTWSNSGGSAWSESDADGGSGTGWDPARTGEFGGTLASTVTVSGTVNANLGLMFRRDGTSLNGGTLVLGAADKASNLLLVETGTTTLGTTVSGSKGLTKSGAGNLVFAQPMTYNGGTDIAAGTLTVAPAAALGGDDVTVSAGATLALQNNLAISNTAALRLVTGATANLGFSPGAEEIVAALFLNGVAQADGTYGASGSGAQFINDAFFSGSGLLRVGEPPPIPTALFWVGDDGLRGGAGTWSNTGGVAWAGIDADIPGGEWDPTKTAVFGGAEAPFATVSGEVSAQRGLLFRTSGATVASGTVNLGGATRADNLLEVVTDTAATIQSTLAGTSGLKKTGPGPLIFSAPMTYSGGTDISTGTLAVSSTGALGGGEVLVAPGALLLLENPNAIPDSATVELSSADGSFGKIDLGFAAGDEERVDALVINGVAQPVGTYGTTESGADNVDNNFFTGLGILRVGSSVFITTTGAPAALDGVYGSLTATSSFTVSGTGLAEGITITPPPGFEVSTDASFTSEVGGHLSPITVGSGGDVPETTIHVRLEPSAGAGGYSGNIVLSSAGADSVNIPTAPSTVMPKPLSITPPLIASRVYDGTTTPSLVTVGTLSGLVGAETLTVSGTAQAFPNKNAGSTNAGSYQDLLVTYALGDGTNGGLAANYSLAPGSGSASITPKPLSISGLTAEPKVYDATTNATVTGTPALDGVVGEDNVSLEGTPLYAFAQAGAGTAIPINITGLSLGGTDAGNYTLSLPALSADITRAPQTIAFEPLPDKTTADAPFALTATASSGLPVSYASSDPAVAEISGSTVTIKTGGSAVITASQAGDANYLPAADVQQTLTVNATFAGRFDFGPHDGSALSFDYNGSPIPNVTVGPMTIVGMASSNNDPNLQGVWPNAGPLNANGAATADLIGTPNKAAYFEFTLTAAPGFALGEPRLRFGVGRELNGPRQFQWRSSADGFASRMTLTQVADDGGVNALPPHQNFSDELRVDDVNFFDGDPIGETVFSEVASTATERTSMTFRFYAYGAETATAGARLTRFLNFLVEVTPATATVPPAPLITGIIPNDGELRVAFTPPPGDVTGYEYTLDGGQNWISTSPASPFTIAGLTNGQTYPFQLRALNAVGTGDASPVQNATPQVNTISGLAATDTRTINGGTYALGATASSGLPVSYQSSNPLVASVSGNDITIVGPGTTTLTASQAGDGDFDPAANVTQTLTVLPSGWTLMEDFEARTPGDLNAQNYWSVVLGNPVGNGTTTVTADPAGGSNQVATLSGTHTAANRFLSSLSPTETFTVFKRFRIDHIDTSATSSGESHLNMGVSNFTAPSNPGDFSLHTSITPTVTTPFRIRHTPESAPSNVTVEPDIWYSTWYVVDNSTGKFKLYVQGGAQITPVLAADGTVTDGNWNFRNPGAIAAARIYLRTLANHNAPAFIDDIYFAPGEALDLPAALVPSFANWAADRGLSGVPTDNFDDDTLADALEYVFGTNPREIDAVSPVTFTRNGAGALVLTFPRDDASETADTVVRVEAGDDLQTWPLVYQVGPNTATSSPGVTVEENGAAPDLITVVIEPAPGMTRVFARVSATVTQP